MAHGIKLDEPGLVCLVESSNTTSLGQHSIPNGYVGDQETGKAPYNGDTKGTTVQKSCHQKSSKVIKRHQKSSKVMMFSLESS
jgi:hypothetical protein